MLVEFGLESRSNGPRIPSLMREERQDFRYTQGGPFRPLVLDGCSVVVLSEAVG